MHDVRRFQAIFLAAEAVEPPEAAERAEGEDASGVLLAFRPERARIEVDVIRDRADLGPGPTIHSVEGLGKVLRILRAARVAVPGEPLALLGDTERALALLERARGTRLRLAVRRRARLSFVAWTDGGLETVTDVVDVLEDEEHYVVRRRGTRAPVRFSRAAVSRRQTQSERWYEVVGIERP